MEVVALWESIVEAGFTNILLNLIGNILEKYECGFARFTKSPPVQLYQ